MADLAPIMNDLRQRLIRRIEAAGPMSLAEYMGECLLNPRDGYYTTSQPFGAQGDFITAPEISQMFGELIGLSLAQAWLDQGAPRPFTLAELGPGRGTLMADLLRATRAVPGFHDALRLHLVEAAPSLRAIQAQALPDPQFHTHIADLPEGPLFLIANEFFDALPMRQAIRDGDGWRERVVTLHGGDLTFALTDAAPLASLENRLEDTAPGDIVEWHPALPAHCGEIARRIADHGGAALIIDYGHWGSNGDTFQALRAHEKVDPLADPGRADLTGHVDFRALARAMAGCATGTMTPQGVFLERLGITARAQSLAANLRGQALDQHIAAHRRLTHPSEMGTLFNILAAVPQGAPLPPGITP